MRFGYLDCEMASHISSCAIACDRLRRLSLGYKCILVRRTLVLILGPRPLKNTPDKRGIFTGWATWTRTKTDGIRIRCPTIRR